MMAFTCSTAFNQTQKNGFLNRNTSVQELQILSRFKVMGLSFQRNSRLSIMVCATTDEKEKNADLTGKEEVPKETSLNNTPSISSSSPFVGAKISSRIAAKSTSNGESKSQSKVSSSIVAPTDSPKVVKPSSQLFQGSSTVTSVKKSSGLEKLKSAKPASVFLDSQQRNFKQPGPKDLLQTLRKSEIESGKTTKFGQPVVPTNLFDEPKRIPSEDKPFEFSFNAGQLVLVFSFLTIIGIMLGTAFLVWKVGGIHYNEF